LKAIHTSVVSAPLQFEGDAWDRVSESAKSLISRLCKKTARERPSAQQTIYHPWLRAERDDSVRSDVQYDPAGFQALFARPQRTAGLGGA